MKEVEFPCCETKFWLIFVASLVLMLLAGIASGLALGLLSFTPVDLEVLIQAGRPNDSKNAARILPIVKNGHLVLCTILIGKSLAAEALPVVMDKILPAWVAVVGSAALVTIFVEIVPQAVAARHGLTLGAKMAPVVRILLLIFFPVSYPASKILDWTLGKEHSVLLRRSELKTFVDLHSNKAGKGGELSLHETSIISGAIDLTEKTAKDAMTPLSQVFSLDINSKLDMHTMTLITSKGHSRIPVHSGTPKSIIGLILVKNLVFCRPEDETPIKNMIIRKIPRVYENWPLYEMLTQFKKGHSHMAVVLKENKNRENTADQNTSTHTFLNVIRDKRSNRVQINEEYSPSFKMEENQGTSIYVSTLSSGDTKFHSATLNSVMQQDNESHEQLMQSWEHESMYVSQEEIASLPTFLDEEAVGIITMEDVMEQLLQIEPINLEHANCLPFSVYKGDILDETDEYIHVQRK
ncbi:hypothetical protein QN277_000021 [Acacia crassicarpa]|uniref:CNNM transmembrane domain-containing protein n=1 Tax=Acacia crassicarpa TaxID=499986 RepID=A0AAE1N4D7_9FABA|nr:hypothetical protein QN277_000021 [Acacia crassicarpa]